jgi:hypothetical protein
VSVNQVVAVDQVVSVNQVVAVDQVECRIFRGTEGQDDAAAWSEFKAPA